MATEHLVIVGGDAAGMAAASQARRLRKPAELAITAFERSHFTSYSACGIPYWVGGEVDGPDALIARTAEEHRARDIDLRMRCEVTELDLDRGRVRFRELEDGGRESWTGFDKLVLATGARPRRPDLPGIDAPGVHGVQTLDDGRALLDALDASPGRRAVVVGAGYIGVEMAEALIRRGYQVTVLEQSAQPMSTLDPDMGALVHEAMCAMGIETVRGATVTGVLTDEESAPGGGRVRAVTTEDAEYPADVVVLGLGVRPETTLAAAAGLPLGMSGGLLTDLAMRVRGHDHLWAGGDCVEVLDLVSGQLRHIALGTHANKHGQVIGTNAGGGYATFPGVVGTAVSKVCDLEIARTGLLEREAHAAGLRFVTVTVEATNRAGYYPGARPMHVKMLAERRTGRLLGVQIVGREGAGKRVDIAAVALTAGMTVEQMTALDLGYAPPFSPVWDPVLVAARKAVGAVREAGA
ncbi:MULTISPECIES: FAD-dependent oxidoreductase [unclassified Streptomyces]|uniref:FAD-dependent oxidoreductase n=1 Tax=unclassified Streptomyces TaxID=2593676 RepID=UPI00087FB682|nr:MULTISPECIES: FAD-dependent oxidoreductase [unclassified Streptomyces]PBC85630.1 NADPH-dependent 2,4-dienoyl-CoA reductase/sulfur reductase-like enzyme [Streptomyces sp. 2321.6]SDR10106.1 NADPH-dependent 2,4-dienoyl-CoA reductase, sulfur reductase [Streptomyces sp. KS_16]SED74244.1 NADPH-dependent 2,4-dienoyl-CoA reductase, sulfur reductase [Streptomyces sp. 2133.1]SNC72336.1 NADPH-dependent 2,4-dienoyl-CoA reductase, sulfur reductase [Streptomyces sp. 2114.4]